MSDSLPTIWTASPHTLAKHRILGGYLKAWMPIVSRLGRDALFIDGFAGPGKYEGGEDGSPVVAIKVALGHSHSFPRPISFLFIEEDDDRFKQLVSVVNDLNPRISDSSNIRLLPPQKGDCNVVLGTMLDEYESRQRPFGPALVFLDQFGYSAVPMELVGRIMKNPNCEILSYMNWSRLHPYMTDKTKWAGITRAFGNESWKECLDLRPNKREEAFRSIYCRQLRSSGNSKFVWHFAMCGEGDQLLYWLFFCTNNIRGIEEMKKAMWGVDDKGSFRFSDGDDPNQLSFFRGATDEWLADHLHKRFLGSRKTVGEINEYVLVETPCYKFKRALKSLQDRGRLRAISNDPNYRKGDFSDEKITVEFMNGPPVQGALF